MLVGAIISIFSEVGMHRSVYREGEKVIIQADYYAKLCSSRGTYVHAAVNNQCTTHNSSPNREHEKVILSDRRKHTLGAIV